jgi:hypothetical protein
VADEWIDGLGESATGFVRGDIEQTDDVGVDPCLRLIPSAGVVSPADTPEPEAKNFIASQPRK